MATPATRTKSAADQRDLPGAKPDEIRQRIASYSKVRNLDALRDEALTLVTRQELTQAYLERIKTHQQALRTKLEELTAHEHYSVVITAVDRNGSQTAEVAGLGTARVQVAVHPDVNPDELIVGASGLVARERNCLLKVSAPAARWNEVARFERYLDSPSRILLRTCEGPGNLLAVDVAERLCNTPLEKGDLIGYDGEVAGMAFERLEAPTSEHLFDENVTDEFAELGGLEREISHIKRHIDFRFRFPEIASKYALKSKCGILLKGAPGNGKTRIARCCAGYVRQLHPDRPCRFMHVAGSCDYNMWFGEAEQKIIERFTAVREAAADGLGIMFWDEVDAIARRRGTDYGSGAPDRILNTFLSQIDGVVPLSNVVIVYATNRADVLDPGLTRSGRIDERIEIPRPNRRAAAAILRCYLNRLPPDALKPSAEELMVPLLSRLFAPNGKYAEVARVKLSDGRRLPVAGRHLLSGAMLENVVALAAQEAAVREAETGEGGLTEEDIALALEMEMTGAVSVLSPGNVKSYVQSVPQDAQPIAVESLLMSSTSTYLRPR